jgi:pyruvate dehydrogenase E1 component alpha subunit
MEVSDIADRALPMPYRAVAVDGNDVRRRLRGGAGGLQRARTGRGPTLMECKTLPHAGPLRRRPGGGVGGRIATR